MLLLSIGLLNWRPSRRRATIGSSNWFGRCFHSWRWTHHFPKGHVSNLKNVRRKLLWRLHALSPQQTCSVIILKRAFRIQLQSLEGVNSEQNRARSGINHVVRKSLLQYIQNRRLVCCSAPPWRRRRREAPRARGGGGRRGIKTAGTKGSEVSCISYFKHASRLKPIAKHTCFDTLLGLVASNYYCLLHIRDHNYRCSGC